jgi:chromosomal replication initiation ATPase DnaA
MVARMERSFDAARRLVAALDVAALAERRNITVPLVRRVLDQAIEED